MVTLRKLTKFMNRSENTECIQVLHAAVTGQAADSYWEMMIGDQMVRVSRMLPINMTRWYIIGSYDWYVSYQRGYGPDMEMDFNLVHGSIEQFELAMMHAKLLMPDA